LTDLRGGVIIEDKKNNGVSEEAWSRRRRQYRLAHAAISQASRPTSSRSVQASHFCFFTPAKGPATPGDSYLHALASTVSSRHGIRALAIPTFRPMLARGEFGVFLSRACPALLRGGFLDHKENVKNLRLFNREVSLRTQSLKVADDRDSAFARRRKREKLVAAQ